MRVSTRRPLVLGALGANQLRLLIAQLLHRLAVMPRNEDRDQEYEQRRDRDRVIGPMAPWMLMQRMIERKMRLFYVKVEVGVLSLAQTRMGMSTYNAFDLSFSRSRVGAVPSAR